MNIINKCDYERIKIMEDTIKCCREGFYRVPGEGYDITLPSPQRQLDDTVYWNVSKKADTPIKRKKNTIVNVVNEDTVEAAYQLKKNEGLHPAILNMASCWQPGGAALDGKSTQEESLFRRSTLCMSLYPFDKEYAKYAGFPFEKQIYPERDVYREYYEKTGLKIDTSREFRAFISNNVMFFRGQEKDGCPYLKDPFTLTVFTMSAIKNPIMVFKDGYAKLSTNDEKIATHKIRTILRMGIHNGNDSLVLGAWGCGAYGNPPRHIAELFKKVIFEEEFRDKYINITFAIRSRDESNRNLSIFRSVFLK